MGTSKGRATLLGRGGARGGVETLTPRAPRARALPALAAGPAAAASAVTLAVATLAAAGCGAGGTPPRAPARAAASDGARSTASNPPSADAPGAASAEPFAWLRPAPPPAGWRRARLASGAALSYPPAWRRVAGDAGTATVGLRDARGRYLGYLNATPRQGSETLAGWAAFRVAHNRAEGQRGVQRLAAARDVPFGTARASCVQDAYTTVIGARYVELACLVHGARASTVVVGAALRRSWPAERATLQRALAALET